MFDEKDSFPLQNGMKDLFNATYKARCICKKYADPPRCELPIDVANEKAALWGVYNSARRSLATRFGQTMEWEGSENEPEEAKQWKMNVAESAERVAHENTEDEGDKTMLDNLRRI